MATVASGWQVGWQGVTTHSMGVLGGSTLELARTMMAPTHPVVLLIAQVIYLMSLVKKRTKLSEPMSHYILASG